MTVTPEEADESAAASAALEGLTIDPEWRAAVREALGTPGGIDALIRARVEAVRSQR